MQVFEFKETSDVMIVMRYFPAGNITDANISDYEQQVSAFGQILEGLEHLHHKGIVHRDLKPENILIETEPLFKAVITDFGLAKIVPADRRLKTFCGTLYYQAPEVFPNFSDGYYDKADIWSLGVIVLEWIYGIPTAPVVPREKKGQMVTKDQWHSWIVHWGKKLTKRLDNLDKDDKVMEILPHMLEIECRFRWPSTKCLMEGFEINLFRRREADGLIEYTNDPVDQEDEDGTKTPTGRPPRG